MLPVCMRFSLRFSGRFSVRRSLRNVDLMLGVKLGGRQLRSWGKAHPEAGLFEGYIACPACLYRRERSQSSTMKVLMENPIQKAMPKNCLGSRWVRGLVAKNTPITGRV